MKTFLAQNQFLNPSVIPEPPTERSTADSACRLQNVARPDATAERDPHPIPSSDGRRQSLADGSFLSGSTLGLPDSSESAVASSDLQPRATAETISNPVAKATKGKAGTAGVNGPVRRSTAGTGLRVGEASADLPATSEIMDATARRDEHPISKSALASAMTADAAAGPEFADPPVPAAVCFDCGYRDPCDEDCPNYIDEPSMTNGGDQEAPASAPSKNPDVGVLADRIDWHEFFEAVMDERIVLFELYDEVPLFLRDGDHLRRWEA